GGRKPIPRGRRRRQSDQTRRWCFPQRDSHAEKIERPRRKSGSDATEDALHLRDSVRLAHRSRRVMTSKAAAVKGQAGVAEGQVQRMPYQIVDDEGMARHAQAFRGKTQQLLGSQMMDEERAAHNVKTVVAKGQSESVAADINVGAVHVQV